MWCVGGTFEKLRASSTLASPGKSEERERDEVGGRVPIADLEQMSREEAHERE